MFCSVETCSSLALFQCSCEVPDKLFCELHCDSHQLQEPSHKTLPIYIPLSSPDKQCVLSTILEEFKILNQLKKRLEQIASIIICTLNSSLAKALNPIIKSQTKLLSQIKEFSEMSAVKRSEFERFIEDDGLTFRLKADDFDYINVLMEIDSYYTKDFMGTIEKFNNKSEGLCRRFAFFSNNSTSLVDLNPVIGELRVSELKLDKTMGGYAGSCLLPNKKVFYYGGQINVVTWPLEMCCIIDPEMNKVEYKRKGPKRLYNIGICAYLNEKVYMFGGSGKCGSLSKKAFEYDIKTDNWKEICFLPVASEKNCAIAAFNKIAVTGSKIGAYFYDVDKDLYVERMQKSECAKILLDCGRKLVLLMAGKVYKWDEEKVEVFEKCVGVVAELYLRSYPVIYSHWVYFLLSDKCVYRIHHRTYVIEKLRKFEELS